MIYAFKNSFDMSRHFIQVFQQHLLADFDKDHQNGDSIFLSSLKASSLSLSLFLHSLLLNLYLPLTLSLLLLKLLLLPVCHNQMYLLQF